MYEGRFTKDKFASPELQRKLKRRWWRELCRLAGEARKGQLHSRQFRTRIPKDLPYFEGAFRPSKRRR